jgi:hypothetical protein
MKTTKINSSLIALVMAFVVNSNAANVNILPSFNGSTLTFESSVSTITPTLGSSGILVNKTLAVGDTFTYVFVPTDLTQYLTSSSLGFTTLGFSMTGTSAAPAAFSMDLYGLNASSEVSLIQSFSGFVPTSSTSAFVELTAGTVGNLSVIDNVIGFGFTFNVADIAVNTTINSLQANVDLSAIPEPSVASLLALGTVGLVALRVRRKS